MVEGFALGAVSHHAPFGGKASNQSPFHSVKGAAKASWIVLTSTYRWHCLGWEWRHGPVCEEGKEGGTVCRSWGVASISDGASFVSGKLPWRKGCAGHSSTVQQVSACGGKELCPSQLTKLLRIFKKTSLYHIRRTLRAILPDPGHQRHWRQGAHPSCSGSPQGSACPPCDSSPSGQ